ncbi:unnamed protein product [Adineta steineri]|uniref:Uncharacterized protein n=1 Tax=Adineta steineri TaxID=433720 RepID=A0A819HKV0_9BILA|nr:unnamed protein product [Adineta steineri]
MSDKKPLLKTHNPLSIDTDSDNENKSFSGWRQYFNQQKTDARNKKLNDKIKHTTKDIPVSFLQLFRFADRIDLLLITIALCLILGHAACLLAKVILFGQITGLFATTSFSVDCDNQYQNLASTIINNTVCPLGIDLNPLNYDRLQKYDKELKLNEWCTVRKNAAFGAYNGWLFFISFLVYSIGFTFGSILMSYGNHRTLTISEILIVVNMFGQASSFLNSIGSFFQSIAEAQGAAVSVFRLIDEVHDENLNERGILQENISSEKSIFNINGDIEFDNVSFSYPSRENVAALHNLKLIARANQTTALVGSSGCGKSTCVSLLLRYYEPSSGRIMIDDQSITDYKIKQFRQNIAVILFGISIYENIRFGKLNATRAEIENAEEQANAHKFIMKLPKKYDTLVGESGIQLSGGEKQRIALARALVKQPNILLLDEATSALDNVSEKIVQEALDRACKNRTTIAIAHRLTTIQNADYIYVLDEGSVIEEGTHETLLAKEGGKYQTMVKMQQSIKTIHTQDELMNMTKAEAEDEEQPCMLLLF